MSSGNCQKVNYDTLCFRNWERPWSMIFSVRRTAFAWVHKFIGHVFLALLFTKYSLSSLGTAPRYWIKIVNIPNSRILGQIVKWMGREYFDISKEHKRGWLFKEFLTTYWRLAPPGPIQTKPFAGRVVSPLSLIPSVFFAQKRQRSPQYPRTVARAFAVVAWVQFFLISIRSIHRRAFCDTVERVRTHPQWSSASMVKQIMAHSKTSCHKRLRDFLSFPQ